MKKRRIHFLSAARSDYDLFAPVLFELKKQSKVEMGVIASSAQLSPHHGKGRQQIVEDGWPIVAQLETLVASDTWAGRGLSFANLMEALVRQLERDRPDLLVVTGDREEHLAGALAASFLRIHVAHLHGGDRCIASDIDELMRPAISKLSHFHFTATEGHRQRLIRMGEMPANVWATGAPSLDRLRLLPRKSPGSVLKKLGLAADSPFFLVIQHPSPMLSRGRERKEMEDLLDGVLATGENVVCSYPNIDPGNVEIRNAIDAIRQRNPRLAVYHNLPREDFVALYRGCTAIVGNSSSLLVESAFLKKPAILVGPRQDLRDRPRNVLRLDFDRERIRKACGQALALKGFAAVAAKAKSLYGDGHSAERVARLLARCRLDPALLLKSMPY